MLGGQWGERGGGEAAEAGREGFWMLKPKNSTLQFDALHV